MYIKQIQIEAGKEAYWIVEKNDAIISGPYDFLEAEEELESLLLTYNYENLNNGNLFLNNNNL